MRVLFVSNLYPPFALGGYEQWCQEVAAELVERGHDVHVLTSTPPYAAPLHNDDITVYRLLHLELDGGLFHTAKRLLADRARLEQANLNYVHMLTREVQPDSVLMWGMWNVPRSVPALIEELLPGRVAYFFCDYWPSLPSAYIQRWEVSARRSLTSLPKRLLGSFFLPRLRREPHIALRFERPICVSKAVCQILVDAGVPVEHGQIIYGGTQVEDFVEASQQRLPRDPHTLRLLYVGRLAADKGVHTAIKAVSQIVNQRQMAVTFDIVGKGDPDYVAELQALIRDGKLEGLVQLHGGISRTEIPALLARYDVLIFSSEWEEPFARTVLEAMAAGLAVIGTTTGGTSEILIDGQNGLAYPAGDAKALAEQIARFYEEPAFQEQLASAGQRCVLEKYRFTRMVNEIEIVLQQMAESCVPAGAG